MGIMADHYGSSIIRRIAGKNTPRNCRWYRFSCNRHVFEYRRGTCTVIDSIHQPVGYDESGTLLKTVRVSWDWLSSRTLPSLSNTLTIEVGSLYTPLLASAP